MSLIKAGNLRLEAPIPGASSLYTMGPIAMDNSPLSEGEVHSLLTASSLELILFPTEKCNFRCTYCYEDFAIGKMPQGIIRGVKTLIEKRIDDIERLKIVWFGGEPLVARDVVLDIAEFASSLCRVHDVGFSSHAVTNGFFLTPDLVARLVDRGVDSFQVSMDGPKAFHDKTRVRQNGQGSFDVIYGNLLALRSTDLTFKVTIRVHATPENAGSLEAFASELYERFGQDSRFNVYVKGIKRLGGPADHDMAVLRKTAETSLIDNVNAALHKVKSSGSSPFCYAAHANSFVIRSDGRLGKCTVALNDDRNTIGSLTPDGDLLIDNERLRPWIRGVLGHDRSTLHCPYGGMLASPPALASPAPT